MGIDTYLRWQGITEDERAVQQTGYSVVHGHVGYLREAYHGEPYATRVLVPEAFEPTPGDDGDVEGAVRIPAWALRNRLPAALSVARERALRVYGERLSAEAPELRAYVNFVALAERLEAAAREPRVLASY
jgi:hypothetical protein